MYFYKTVQNITRSQKAAQSKSHRFSRCHGWGVKTLLGFIRIWIVIIWVLEFCHNSSFWVLLKFMFFLVLLLFVLSQFEVCHNMSAEFCQNLFFLICHNLSSVLLVFELSRFGTIWAVSQFKFLSFVTIWVFKFCHKMSFKFFHNLGLVTTLVFELSHLSLSFVTIWVVTIWVFALSHFDFLLVLSQL